MIRVLVVDDQALVRAGLRRLLELSPELSVVGEARDGQEALTMTAQHRPDVILLDVRMPGLDGPGVLRALGSRGPLPTVLMLTTFDDDGAMLACIEAGARGYLLKDVSYEELLKAIRAVARGESAWQPSLTERVRSVLTADPPGLQQPEALTERELEILRLIAGGYTNRQIAAMLGLREGTVKNHLSRVLSKLGARDRTSALIRAINQGLL